MRVTAKKASGCFLLFWCDDFRFCFVWNLHPFGKPDLYVTLEPCPMCTGAIINARIRRLCYGAKDPKAGSCGSVVNLFELPYNHKPQVISGVLEEACAERLSGFFRSLRERKKNGER